MAPKKLQASDGYVEALQLKSAKKKGKEDLVDLDRWYRGALRSAIQAREPEMFLTQPELVKLVKWKLARGSWRPKLLGYAEGQTEEDVETASTAAFKHAGEGDLKSALASMMRLKGVGAATASAVLAAGIPSVPFMSDELLLDVIGEKKYTAAAFAQLNDKLKKKLANDTNNAEDYEKCLWAAKHGVGSQVKRTKGDNEPPDRAINKSCRKS